VLLYPTATPKAFQKQLSGCSGFFSQRQVLASQDQSAPRNPLQSSSHFDLAGSNAFGAPKATPKLFPVQLTFGGGGFLLQVHEAAASHFQSAPNAATQLSWQTIVAGLKGLPNIGAIRVLAAQGITGGGGVIFILQVQFFVSQKISGPSRAQSSLHIMVSLLNGFLPVRDVSRVIFTQETFSLSDSFLLHVQVFESQNIVGSDAEQSSLQYIVAGLKALVPVTAVRKVFLVQLFVSVLQRQVNESHVAFGEILLQSFLHTIFEELKVLAEPFATL
jgi:uncharacterized protein YjfI (DUF2170 family)